MTPMLTGEALGSSLQSWGVLEFLKSFTKHLCQAAGSLLTEPGLCMKEALGFSLSTENNFMNTNAHTISTGP